MGMKKFEVLKMITDEKKFSELIFDLIHVYDTSDKLVGLLAEEKPEKELQTIKSIAQSAYPLSFDLKQ